MKTVIIFIDEETLTEEELDEVCDNADASEDSIRFAGYPWEVNRYGQTAE